MIKQAILFTKDNAAFITDSLIDYTNATDLIAEYEYMFANYETLVLCKDVIEPGIAVLSYVVTRSMFKANNPTPLLNDKVFTTI